MDAGMEVIYTGLRQSAEAIARAALEEDVDVIGVSSLATDHLIVPKLMQALGAADLQDIAVIVGGIVPVVNPDGDLISVVIVIAVLGRREAHPANLFVSIPLEIGFQGFEQAIHGYLLLFEDEFLDRYQGIHHILMPAQQQHR